MDPATIAAVIAALGGVPGLIEKTVALFNRHDSDETFARDFAHLLSGVQSFDEMVADVKRELITEPPDAPPTLRPEDFIK
jgi:hypothetical protein